MRLFLFAVLLAAVAPVRALEVQSENFSGRWLAPDAELRIKLDGLAGAAGGVLAFVDGATDLTPFFRQVGPGEFLYSGRQLPLAPGQRALKVYLVKDGQWQELRSLDLKVTTASGFEVLNVAPRLDVTVKGQLAQARHGAGAPPATRSDFYQDYTLQGGFALEAQRDGVALASRANIQGSTFQPEAIRFGTIGEHAPQVDIADYLFDLRWGQRTQLLAGHMSYGNNPLLLMGYGSRGLLLRQQLSERFDFSVNAMNGTSIVGAGNLLGVGDSQHQVRGGSVGYEFLDRKGGLRAELQYLDASLKSLVPFNAGAIPDAEKINGTGFRVLGSDASGRLRADLAIARVRHEAPRDPILEQGQTLTAIRPETKGARSLDLAYDFVKMAQGPVGGLPFMLTATMRQERIDPLFKSVGIGFPADQQFRRYGLAAQVGPAQAQWFSSRREDNLENIPTILKTRTLAEGVALAVPLATFWPKSGDAPPLWLPTLSFRQETNHQRAINVPPPALSAFTAASHLPEQYNEIHSLGANWSGPDWQLAYSFNLATQDNRQPGRDTADFHNTGHNVQAGYRFSPTFGVTAGFGRTANYANERTLTTYTDNWLAGFDWQFRERWSLSGNYSFNFGNDTQSIAESRGETLQTQLAWRFSVASPFGERNLPGQLFLRHLYAGNQNRDNVFGLLNAGRYWAIQTGVTVSFF